MSKLAELKNFMREKKTFVIEVYYKLPDEEYEKSFTMLKDEDGEFRTASAESYEVHSFYNVDGIDNVLSYNIDYERVTGEVLDTYTHRDGGHFGSSMQYLNND